MKFQKYLYILFFMMPTFSQSEPTIPSMDEESIMSRPDFTNSLTVEERDFLIKTIKITIRVLADNDHMEELKESKLFNSFNYSYPKQGVEDGIVFNKDKLLSLYFNNNNKNEITWTSAGITFDINRFNNKLMTLFTSDDFDKLLDLTFEGVNKEIVEYNGKEIGSYYLYTYHWKLNKKLKVMFRVQDNFYIKEDDYPRDFYMIDMVLDQ